MLCKIYKTDYFFVCFSVVICDIALFAPLLSEYVFLKYRARPIPTVDLIFKSHLLDPWLSQIRQYRDRRSSVMEEILVPKHSYWCDS